MLYTEQIFVGSFSKEQGNVKNRTETVLSFHLRSHSGIFDTFLW